MQYEPEPGMSPELSSGCNVNERRLTAVMKWPAFGFQSHLSYLFIYL